MTEPNIQELNKSIEMLTVYRDRLKEEITVISQKLQIPEKKINSTLNENTELTNLQRVLDQLIKQRDKSN
ncbi:MULTISPECIES: hypothetical protein [Prochlorococcus]|uniref:hypothetical protein n=1 Tax=Prochlorococcus TaxID=1218 RepID=UPI00055E4131|nr:MULTISPECIES: hypothetical protein [Prochlorococcus]